MTNNCTDSPTLREIIYIKNHTNIPSEQAESIADLAYEAVKIREAIVPLNDTIHSLAPGNTLAVVSIVLSSLAALALTTIAVYNIFLVRSQYQEKLLYQRGYYIKAACDTVNCRVYRRGFFGKYTINYDLMSTPLTDENKNSIMPLLDSVGPLVEDPLIGWRLKDIYWSSNEILRVKYDIYNIIIYYYLSRSRLKKNEPSLLGDGRFCIKDEVADLLTFISSGKSFISCIRFIAGDKQKKYRHTEFDEKTGRLILNEDGKKKRRDPNSYESIIQEKTGNRDDTHIHRGAIRGQVAEIIMDLEEILSDETRDNIKLFIDNYKNKKSHRQ